MSIILGINKDHSDSSACLLIDGKLIGAVAEERLGERLKHDSSFPKNSIKWLLKESNIKYSDINVIAVSNNSLSNLPNKFFHSFDFSSNSASFNLLAPHRSNRYCLMHSSFAASVI